MAPKTKGGLGKGLDALMFDNSTEEENVGTITLKLHEIEPNRDQPRKSFNDDSLSELAESIAEHGIIQPLIVRAMPNGGYQLVAGERRWRAARIAGLNEVPVLVRQIDNSEIMEIALVENLQREDLNPIEEAMGLRSLIDDFGLTQEQAAKKVGKSRPAVANALRLLALPSEVLSFVREGKISQGHAKALLALSDEKDITALANEIIEKGMSVRDTERACKYVLKQKGQKPKQQTKKRDTFYDEMELSFRETVGRNAKIKVNPNGRGSIEIEFFDKNDLCSILELFNRD